MKGNHDHMEISPKMSCWERRIQSRVRKVKRKIVKLRNQKKQDLTLNLLTTDLNNMNLTKDEKNQDLALNLLTTELNNMNLAKDEKNINSDVNRVKIGSLLDLVTQYSPNNEAVWLESCRMASPIEAKQVIARGLNALPSSVNLWMKAAELEDENMEKMRVLMKGIESNPNSIRLWKEVVGIANEDDARFLLCKAVECCPMCIEFWLALACLQKSYDEVKMVLDKANEKHPKNLTLQAIHVLAGTKDITAVIGIIAMTGFTSLTSKEILDTDGARLANEALLKVDVSVARWELIKVLLYNASWERTVVPKGGRIIIRSPCKTPLSNSQ